MSNVSTVTPSPPLDQSSMNQQQAPEIVFTVLQVAGGQALLPLLTLTVLLSSRIKRHPVFINFCLSWIFSSVVFCLLIYGGRTQDYTDLSDTTFKNSCIAQASLVNGVQGYTVTATLALVVHFWLIIFSSSKAKFAGYSPQSNKLTSKYIWTLLGVPYLTLIIFFLVSFSFARHPMEMPQSRHLPLLPVFICSVANDADSVTSIVPCLKLQLSVIIFSLIISIVCVFFEVHALLMIYQKRGSLRKVVSSGWLSMIFRIGLFSLFRTVSNSWDMFAMLEANESAISNKAVMSSSVAFFLQASIPLLVFFTFATEKDLFHVWFCKRGSCNSKVASEKSESMDQLHFDSKAPRSSIQDT